MSLSICHANADYRDTLMRSVTVTPGDRRPARARAQPEPEPERWGERSLSGRRPVRPGRRPGRHPQPHVAGCLRGRGVGRPEPPIFLDPVGRLCLRSGGVRAPVLGFPTKLVGYRGNWTCPGCGSKDVRECGSSRLPSAAGTAHHRSGTAHRPLTLPLTTAHGSSERNLSGT